MANTLGLSVVSGLCQLNDLNNIKYHDIKSSFSPPSDKTIEGSIDSNIESSLR